MKRIVLEREDDPNARKDIVEFCRTHYAHNSKEPTFAEEFNQDYCPGQAIWWYTRDCFFYQLLNRALRFLQSDVIIDMGFMIRDLHQQLEQLRREQYADYRDPPLILYRNQPLSKEDFAHLERRSRGLLVFYGFLSASKVKSAAIGLAQPSSIPEEMVPLVFRITVDPKLRSVIFADIENQSYDKKEGEILFSMNTAFRIGVIQQSHNEGGWFEVELTAVDEDDPDLRRATDCIKPENNGMTEWKQLAAIKNKQGDYKEALKLRERALETEEEQLSSTDPALAASYNDIGGTYYELQKYENARTYFEKALDIRKRALHPGHPQIRTSLKWIELVNEKLSR